MDCLMNKCFNRLPRGRADKMADTPGEKKEINKKRGRARKEGGAQSRHLLANVELTHVLAIVELCVREWCRSYTVNACSVTTPVLLWRVLPDHHVVRSLWGWNASFFVCLFMGFLILLLEGRVCRVSPTPKKTMVGCAGMFRFSSAVERTFL